MNRYTTNTSVRERPVTVAPLPFEAMYKSLQDRQARYDQAEAFELENKAQVSKLSTPIADHQAYLDDYKSRYLKEAEVLHKSNPDKGSPEYRRKLQELVSSYANDRNRILIERSAGEYLKYVEDKTKKFNEGKYSPAADFYTSFKGIGTNGEILPFTYAGMRDKVDWKKEQDEIIKNIPLQKRKLEYVKDGQKIVTNREVKPWQAIKAGLGGMSKEALQDMAYDLGLKDTKELDSHLDNIAKLHQQFNTEDSQTYDFSLQKEMRDRVKFAQENMPSNIPSNLTNAPNPWDTKSSLENIDDEGNIIPSGIWFQSSSNTFENDPEIGKIIANAKSFGYTGKQVLRELKKTGNSRIKNLGIIPVADDKERNFIANQIISAGTNAKFYGPEGQVIEGEKAKTLAKSLIDKDAIFVQGKLSANPYAPEAYVFNKPGEGQYIAALENDNFEQNLMTAVSRSFLSKKPVKLENFGVTVVADPLVEPNENNFNKTVKVVDTNGKLVPLQNKR
jgi:hypothetical protein